MRRIRTLAAAAFVLALAGAAVPLPGRADFALGINDSDAETFTHPRFADLNVARARGVFPFDVAQRPAGDPRRQELEQWLESARLRCVEPMIVFNRSTLEPYDLGDGLARAPTGREYAAAFRAFRRAYPAVRIFGAWNEPNASGAGLRTPNGNRGFHESDCPSPARLASCGPLSAAFYWRLARMICPRCTHVAGEFTGNVTPGYWRAYQRFLRAHRPKVWGIHPFADLQRYVDDADPTSSVTLDYLSTLTGTWAYASNRTRSHVWLTATGAYRRAPGASDGDPPVVYTDEDQREAYRFLFRDLADLNTRITRVYVSSYQNVCPGGVCPVTDRGLVAPNGAIDYDTPDRVRLAFAEVAARFGVRSGVCTPPAPMTPIVPPVMEPAHMEDEPLSEPGPDPLAGIDPMAPDADGDGVPDDLDEDADGDGIWGEEELEGSDTEDPPDSDGDGIPDPIDADDDGDGVLTADEMEVDADMDGIPDHLDGDSFGAAPRPEAGGCSASGAGGGGAAGVAWALVGIALAAGRRVSRARGNRRR